MFLHCPDCDSVLHQMYWRKNRKWFTARHTRGPVKVVEMRWCEQCNEPRMFVEDAKIDRKQWRLP